ncbi:MAG: hypothetical protein KGL39_22455 [Patescibacteria group bacterium]|nr:hypothetical protein [Patescibacteria group bacterium]
MSLDHPPEPASEALAHPIEAAGPVGRFRMVDAVPVRDKLLWSWDDVSALTSMSRRMLEREVSAGRMPAPDVRIGRRACFRPATITTWLDSFAQKAQGRRLGQ